MDLIVVQSFYDITELAIARNLLESEGIATITRDEQSTQSLGPEARAIGGAKLMVKTNEYALASELLIEKGIMNANPNPQDFPLVDFLDSFALKIPFIHTLTKEFRLIFIGFLIVAIPFLITVLSVI